LIQQQMQEQQAINAELRQRFQAQQATIDGFLARLARLEEAGARPR
jgi:pantothenate kinase